MSGKAHSWYSRRGLFRNGHFARALDRVVREALACEVTRGLDARPSSPDDPLRSNSLRLECVNRGLHELGGDASLGQVMPDQGVSGPAPGEDLRATSCEPLVVNRTRLNQASHGLAADGRSNPSPGEPLGKLFLGQITPRERAGGLRQRIAPDELSTYPPGPRAVELNANVQARRQHGLGRQGPPVLPVESDLDAPARPREQGANPWRQPLRGQLRPP